MSIENEKKTIIHECIKYVRNIVSLEMDENKDYVLRKLEYMDNLIMNESNLDNIGDEIRNTIENLYQPKQGLAEFFIWRESFEERRELNLEFEKRINIIISSFERLIQTKNW